MSDEPAFESFTFLEPWEVVTRYAHDLEHELRKEVSQGHPLHEIGVQAIARRRDSDDILFRVDLTEHPYAVVHLTWTGGPERAPNWPDTQFFSTWEQWVEKRMKPDNVECRSR